MIGEAFRFLSQYSQAPFKIDRLIVSTFLLTNNIKARNNVFIKKYQIQESKKKEYLALLEFVSILKRNEIPKLSLEDLISLFEFVISPADKVVNGAVYTPAYIRTYIIESTLGKKNHNTPILIGDISCGCGGFLFDAARLIRNKTNKSFYKIFKDNIYGLDIENYSIVRTKIILCLLALTEGEDRANFSFNLFKGNALNFNWFKKCRSVSNNGGFDVIVGNPPYVGASKISESSRKYISNWAVSNSGKADLYIPFFQIGLENLNNDGELGYITVNTFYKSVNGRALRKYFSKHKSDLTIVDFGGEQVFKKRSTYTCICTIKKSDAGAIHYTKSDSRQINSLTGEDFQTIAYSTVDDHEGWLLNDKATIINITKIQNIGTPLGKLFDIKNGFATLRNDIYVFDVIEETDHFLRLEKNSRKYWIEKAICRNVVKPNILKVDSDTHQNIEKIIFPYSLIQMGNHGTAINEIKLFTEKIFKDNYPLAYSYLLEFKDELKKRDRGKRKYEKWFAFGRTQALTISGLKLLFPYIADRPYFIFTEDNDLLFYNGYAILSNSKRDLLWLQKVLKSRIFWYYIINSSKPYDNKYFSLAKNYIKKFGICPLDENEKNTLIGLNDPSEIDLFLFRKYQIHIDGFTERIENFATV